MKMQSVIDSNDLIDVCTGADVSNESKKRSQYIVDKSNPVESTEESVDVHSTKYDIHNRVTLD